MNKIFQIAFVISIIAIEYLATTTISIQIVENSWDKSNHFISFFVLYILMSYGFRQLTFFNKITLLMIFAIQIEVVQYFIPNRDFSLLDIFADGVGIFIGFYIVYYFQEK